MVKLKKKTTRTRRRRVSGDTCKRRHRRSGAGSKVSIRVYSRTARKCNPFLCTRMNAHRKEVHQKESPTCNFLRSARLASRPLGPAHRGLDSLDALDTLHVLPPQRQAPQRGLDLLREHKRRHAAGVRRYHSPSTLQPPPGWSDCCFHIDRVIAVPQKLSVGFSWTVKSPKTRK
jgi:hypothetical protein